MTDFANDNIRDALLGSASPAAVALPEMKREATLEDYRALGRSLGADYARVQIIGLAQMNGNPAAVDEGSQVSTDIVNAQIAKVMKELSEAGCTPLEVSTYAEAAFGELARRTKLFAEAIA